jgi:Transcription factor WhiB
LRQSAALATLWPTDQPAPDLRKILAARPAWHEQAKCADSDAFFPDEQGTARGNMAAAAQLVPALVCSTCPVRRPCLEAGLETWVFRHDALDIDRGGKRKTADIAVVARSSGIWGATTEQERWHVRDLPEGEAADLLEATMERRIDGRIAAWRELVSARRAHGGGHGRFDKAIMAILAEREVKRFPRTQAWHLHRPGPGRGHRGPIALLAAELGVSRSTAWRRLRAAA